MTRKYTSKRKKPFNYLLIIVISIVLTAEVFLLKPIFYQQPKDFTEISPSVKEYISNIKPLKYYTIPILMYHYVEFVKDEGDAIRKSLNIIPPIFDNQVKTLQEAGYTFLTMADLANIIAEKIKPPKKGVVLTFDDGYRDFYTDVFPILKKYQAKATSYVVNNFLGLPNNLTKEQLQELIDSKLVEIGAHTLNHTYLKGLQLERVRNEVEESKKELEKLLNQKVISFAYPYGVFDEQALAVVKEAGFETAVTTTLGKYSSEYNRLFLNRIRPGIKTGEELLFALENQKFSLVNTGY